MAPPEQHDSALKALDALIHTASALLTRLQCVLADMQRHPAPNNPSPHAAGLDALSLAHDSASLIRAHGTKISLLIINEPFTPSAICTVLRELIAGPIPGLASSAQACTSQRYTELVRRDVASKAGRVLSELRELVRKIPRDGKVLPESGRAGFAAGDKGSLPVTGLLWAACDEVIGLSKLGVGGVLAKRVDQWKDILGDIMEELKAWADEEPDDDDDQDQFREDDDHHGDDVNHLSEHLETTSLSPQALLDQVMDSPRQIPKSDPNGIRPRLETSLQRLRLLTLLYEALPKRRLKELPAFPLSSSSDITPRLDQMIDLLGTLPDRINDLACAFYDLQPEEIDRIMHQCFFVDAAAAAALFVRTWDGGMDHFSEWLVRFQEEVKKP